MTDKDAGEGCSPVLAGSGAGDVIVAESDQARGATICAVARIAGRAGRAGKGRQGPAGPAGSMRCMCRLRLQALGWGRGF